MGNSLIKIQYIGNATTLDENGVPENLQVRYMSERAPLIIVDGYVRLLERSKGRLWRKYETWTDGVRVALGRWFEILPRSRGGMLQPDKAELLVVHAKIENDQSD